MKVEDVTDEFLSWLEEKSPKLNWKAMSFEDVADVVNRAIEKGILDEDEVQEAIGNDYSYLTKRFDRLEKEMKGLNANSLLKMGADDDSIRVKAPSERYCTKRYTAKHKKTGQPVLHSGREIETPSQMDLAKLGAWGKWKAAKAGLNVHFTDHERALFNEVVDKDDWIGEIGDTVHKIAGGAHVKALIDDDTSGGENLVPNFYDTAVIQFPLLHSELLPYVDLRDIPRGSTVETASVGNPTLTWNTAEGSALTLFSTSALVASITASVFPVAVGIEIGNDFRNDAVVDVGRILVENVGQRMAQELDKVIAAGNGTTQPQGITNASGTTDITPETPTTGPATLNDLINLMFGVGKQYRVPMYGPRYVFTDTTYKRFRQIATGVTGDTRLALGDDVQSYSMLQSPVSIEQQGLSNSDGIFGALKKYRLWRRQGVELKFTSEGATLTKNNTTLLYVRGRYAGRVVDANAFAVADSLLA